MILSLYTTAAPKLLPINYTGQISGNQASNAAYTPSTITSVSSATGTEGTVYYLWEKSTDGTTWTDISGATSASYTPAAITQTTYYRRKSRIGTSGAWEGYSNIVSKVVTNFSITTSSNITTGSAIVLDEAGDFPEVYNQLVVNGDFSNGNTGFISSLTYTTSTTPTAYTYKVAENSQNLYSGTDVTHFKDRTSGVGKMMLGDGKTTANHIVWESTLPVVAGNTYSMSVWVRAIRDVNRPQLKWSVNDANFGTTVTAAYGSWTQVTHTYTATATGNVDFSIYNARGIDAGNMFAIDDVSILESSAISYAWSGPNGFSSTAINPTISGATSVNSGTYNLTITKGGLSVQTSKVIQVVNAAVTCTNTLSLAATNATCGGFSNGSITATAANGFGGSGTVTVQGWFNISGTSVSDLTSNTSYPNSPSYTSALTLAETPSNVADNFGGRLVGYIVPKTTGTYYFWIASDDSGEFWLSTTNSPANKTLRASVNGYTGVREWNKFTSQKSAAITLTAGQVYYFEAIYKEGGGGDNLAIGWSKPGEATTAPSEVIPATALRPYSGTSATDPVYQYKIGTGAFQTSNVFPNLAAGSYSVTVQDSYGCSVTSSITVTAPSTITTTPSSNSPVCTGQTLTLNSGTVSGGSGTISYLWTGPNGFSSTAQNPSITNVTSSSDGTYTLKVTRGSCFSTFTIDVEIDNSPAATTTFVNPSCGASDGKITFNYPVGSDNDMQISLDGGSTWPYTATAAAGSYTATGLSAGTKNIRLRWATGTACVTTIPSVTLVAGTTLQGVTMSPNVTICTGTSTTISGTPQNGTAPFTYAWSPNVGNTSSVTVSPAATTTYTLTVTSANGCSASNQVVVITSTNPVVTITTPDSTICALGGYTLTSAINLSSSFNYQWQTNNNGTWNDILLANGASYTVLLAPAGNVTYRLKVTNSSSSCNIGYSNSFTVKVLTSPVASVVSASNKICLNQSTTFSASVSNGAGAITYQWQNSTDNLIWSNIAGQTSVSYSPVTNVAGATYYRVIANMSGTGCTQAISNAYLFTVVNPGTMNITPAATTLCLNGTQLLTSSVSGSNGSYTYQWQKSSNGGVSWRDMSSATGSTYSPTNDSLGTYKYRVKANASVCGVFYSGTANINVVQPHSVDVSITNATVCVNGSTTLSGTALNLTGTGTYQWMISSNETGPWVNVSNGTGGTTDTYTPATTTAGRYYYKLRVTGPASNCGAVDSEVIMLNVVAQLTVTVSPVSSSICLNSVNYLNALTDNGVGPFTYQWQVSSTSGSGYSNISGATGSSLLIPTGSANTRYYKVIVTPSGAGCNAVTSAFSTVIVMPLPTVSATNTSNSSSSINQCVGTLFKLFATSTNSPTAVTGYSWSSAGGFSSNDQNPLGLATSTASGGTYTVTATGANGCTNTATTNVIINSNCDNRCTSIIDVRPLNPTDCASATGNITVDEFGGTNYETSMDGINWFRGYKVYSALGVGSYLVFLRDYSSKIICRTVNITLEAKTTAFFTGQTVTNATGCKVANGSIRLTGVLSTDQVSWISSRTPTYVAVSTLTNQTIPNLLPGTYYVRVIRGGQYCYSERMVTVGNSGTPCISNQICTTTDLVNLFPNGDFGSGSTKHGPVLTGAETQYGYSLYNCNAPNDGFYTIVNNTDCDGAGGKTFGGAGGAGGWDVLTQDHTTGDTGGYMMVVNASHNPDIVVEKSISNLCPKTQYNFTAWIYNLIPNEDIKPNLSFLIDGVVYYVTGNITTNGWKQVGFSFTTGNITSSVFSIRNNAPGGDGNDWVIDDIVVSKCPMNITMNANVVACVGTASKTITATVADPYQEYVYYKWQESSNNGASWTDISAVTSGTYSGGNMTVSTVISGPFTYAQSGKKYRLKLATTASSIDDATCSVASAEATLTVPQITTTITAPIEKCAGTGSSTLTAAGGGGTSPYTYSWSDALGSTASVTANPAATKTYTVTVTDANGCSTTATAQITIKPLPTGGASGVTICSGAAFNVTPDASAVPNTKYTWTISIISGSVTGQQAQTTAIDGPFSQVLTNTGTVNAVVRYTVTPVANGCSGTPFPFDVTVRPVPAVNNIGNQAVCSGLSTTTVTFGGTGTSYSWTNNNTTIGLASGGTGNINAFTAVNAGNTPITATITVTPIANGCSGPSKTFTITVNPIPTLDQPDNQVLCAGGTTNAVNFTGSISGTTFSWTNNITSIGLAASGTGNINAFTATNTGTTPVTSTIIVTPSSNGCGVATKTFTITVSPKPTVNLNVPSASVCINVPVTLTATINGGTSGLTRKWQSSANGSSGWTDISGQTGLSLIVPTNTPGDIYYRMLVNDPGSGCGEVASTGSKVTIFPQPTVTTPGNKILCTASSSGIISFSGTVAGTTYNWTNNNTATGLAASGTGNIATFTATNTTSAAITSTITVTPSANGCAGDPVTFTITVSPKPTVTKPADQTLCVAATSTAVTFSGTVTGTTYTWTNNNTATGLPASGTGNIASFTATNTTSAAITSTITVIPSANGCAGDPVTFTITVSPKPNVVKPADQTLCVAATSTAVTFSGTVTGTTYTWINNNTATGLAASGTGNIGTFTATNTTSAAITSTITVTPTANGCAGDPVTFTITVSPKPNVVKPADQTLCVTATSTAIAFSGTVTGTTYSWINNNTATGLAASGTGNIASFTATNTTSAAITSTITVTPSANGCTGDAVTFTITVSPKPTVAKPVDQTLCVTAASTAIAFSGTVTGTTYTWTNNNTATGLAASGTGNIASFTATNTTSAAITSTITVIPSANGCAGDPVTFTITVSPKPNVVKPADQTLCVAATSNAITFAGTVSGTTYSWTNNNTATGLAASGTGNIGSFTATNTTSSAITSTITVTPSANGCAGDPVTFTITVSPKPTVAKPTDQTLCVAATSTAIAFSGTVTGTTYSWTNNNTATGVAANGTGNIASFTATNTTSAAITSTITVTPSANGCAGDPVTFTITVNPKPTVAKPVDQTLCASGLVTPINFSGPVSGTTYTWTNNNPSIGLAGSGTGNIGSFTAINNGTTPVTATITVTPKANDCPGTSQTFTITVYPKPTVSVSIPSEIVCIGTPLTLTATVSGGSGNTSQKWQVSSDGSTWTDIAGQTGLTYAVPTNAAAEKYYQIVITDNGSGCGSVTSAPARIKVISTVTIGITPNNNKVCIGETLTLTATINNGTDGLTYQWYSSPNQSDTTRITGQTGLTLTVPTTIKGIMYYRLQVTSPVTGCGTVKSGFTSVEVRPLPAITFTKTDALCETGNGKIVFSFQDEPGQTSLEFSLDGGLTYPYSVNDNSGSFTVNALSSSTYQLYARWGGGACPVNLGTTTISDRPAPLATSLKTDPTCTINNGTIRFNFLDVAGRTGYKFSLDGGLTYLATVADNSGSVTYSGLAPGTYDLWVKWENDECPVNLPDLTLTDQKGPVVDLGQDLEICNGVAVNITAATTGGTPALIYSWNNGLNGVSSHQVSPTITTTYIVTVKDANNCTSKDTLQIIVNANPVLTITNVEVCENQNIRLISSGGGTYAWTGPNSFVSNLQNPEIVNANAALHAGVYSLTITNGFGCHTSGTATVIINALPAPPTLTGAEKCGPGSLTLNASGCSGTISWFDKIFDGNNVGIGTTFATPTLSETTAYFALCSSTKNCDSPVRSSVLAKINNQPVAEIIPVDPTCLGAQSANNGRIIITRYRENEKYSFNIGTTYNSGIANVPALIPSNGTISSTLPNPSNNISQNYTIRIISSEGCTVDRVITIQNKCIDCPVDYCPPSTITKIE